MGESLRATVTTKERFQINWVGKLEGRKKAGIWEIVLGNFLELVGDVTTQVS